MKYRVSYLTDCSKDGTHYNQKISVYCTAVELEAFNAWLDSKLMVIYLRSNRLAKITDSDSNIFCYAQKLDAGRNFTNRTTRDLFLEFNGMKSDRILDRNTLIDIRLSA